LHYILHIYLCYITHIKGFPAEIHFRKKKSAIAIILKEEEVAVAKPRKMIILFYKENRFSGIKKMRLDLICYFEALYIINYVFTNSNTKINDI
jgi:hypothetical protein